jgi:hypothetical protein
MWGCDMAKMDAKNNILTDLATQNPNANAERVGGVVRLIGEMRKLGIRRHEYGLTGPFGKLKNIPKSRRRMAFRERGTG